MFSRISNKKEAEDQNIIEEAKIQNKDGKSLLATGNENVNNIIQNDDYEVPEEDNIAVRLKKKTHIKKFSDPTKKNINDDKDLEKKEKNIAENLIVQNAPQILNLINNNKEQKQQNGESQFVKEARNNGLPLFNNDYSDHSEITDDYGEDNIAVRLKKRTHIKKSSDTDSEKNANTNISKDLLDLIGNGEKINVDKDKVKDKKKSDKSKNIIDINEIKDENLIEEPREKIDIFEGNDLIKADNDMGKVKGQGFTPVDFPRRKKVSTGSRILTGIARFFGKTLGKLFNIIITPFSAFHLIRGLFTRKNNENLSQKKRNYDQIPGWNGKKFEDDPEGNANILADFRRVPTVWSKMTAAKAVDTENKPLPPTVSIYVNQPKEGSDQMMDDMSSGHSGLGIEYTRFSKATGRYERYNLRFGFWQAGANMSTAVMNQYKGAYTLGQLADESGYHYTISRKFKANSKQVNNILKAARTYPDKGYQPFLRNCTTFVRDMMEVGNIAGAKDVVGYEETDLSHSANMYVFGAEVVLSNAKAGQERNFQKLGDQEDKSYAGWGNKRATQADYDLYKQTLENGVGFADENTLFANTPNGAAENLRRLKHDNAGDFGSYQYWDPGINKSIKWSVLANAVKAEGEKVYKLAAAINESESNTNPNWEPDPQFGLLMSELSSVSSPINKINKKFQKNKKAKEDAENAKMEANPDYVPKKLEPFRDNLITIDDVRNCRQELSQSITDVNTLLNKYFKNDKRLHIPMMHLISVLTYAIEQFDEAYADASEQAIKKGELGDLRANMRAGVYDFSFADNPNAKTSFTPTHYESYIQIYGTPEKAVENYRNYLLLAIRKKNGAWLSPSEKKQYAKLSRMEKLADQFDSAHNYMLEKDSFSQQDIDYAFETSAQQRAFDENGVELKSKMFSEHRTSGDAYQTLFLEKVFGGMRSRYISTSSEDSYLTDGEMDLEKLKTWLDTDMTNCLNKNTNDMMMILKGMKKVMPKMTQKNRDMIRKTAMDMILHNWIMKIFTGKNEKIKIMNENAKTIFASLTNDKKTKCYSALDSMIRNLLKEEKALKNASKQSGSQQ
ncbi:MAG: hypothetical protein IJI41_09300 [Anaerolineaceae bacterium]|nr:hypothetical protein [Anaerolineaceae bacterium]